MKDLSPREEFGDKMNPAMTTHPQTGRVVFLDGPGDLPMVEISTPWSTAEIHLHGATVTHFQKKNEQPILWVSKFSRFEKDVPIRGGIPVIFPWFGKPADKPGQHGFVRQQLWEVKEVSSPPDGSVFVRLHLPGVGESPLCPGAAVEYLVGISEQLTVELVVTNNGPRSLTFENCLHTYFATGDIAGVSVSGLQGQEYLDAVQDFLPITDGMPAIRVDQEVDRVYLNSAHMTEIRDEQWQRVIRVEKENSRSTVVWNPWIAKAKRMQDYGDEEYLQMICVESGNVRTDAITLAPGAQHSLKVKLSSRALA
jgi:D-hexose-6-phosphate mutarotase